MFGPIRRQRESQSCLDVIHWLSTGLFVTLGALGIISQSALAQSQYSELKDKVGEEVFQALKQDGEAEVMIMLAEKPYMQEQRSNLAEKKNEIAALQQGVLSAVNQSDYVVRHRYKTIPALAGRVTAEAGLEILASHPDVLRIDLDRGGMGSLGTSVPLINADALHRQGITGKGVVVAVLDSGLDTDHVDLSDDLIDQACFLDNDGVINDIGLCPNGSDRQFGPGAAEDGAGHGTFTTGVITSNGTLGPVGVAPDAKIVSIKVLDDSTFSGVFRFFSEIVAALDYIASERPDVKVINMSFGTFDTFVGDCDHSTSFNMAGSAVINALKAKGVIAFASTGNNGSGTVMTSPACLNNVVSVGSTDNNDEVAGFTNSNATTDVMASGVGIESTGIENTTTTLSGTSFATAHAAGCAALLVDSGAFNTPDEIEMRIKDSPVQVTDAKNGLSFPRLDCGSVEPDHYLLYSLNDIYDDGGIKGRVVHLANRFGSSYFQIDRIAGLANPVDKNQEGIRFRDIHYLAYRIRGERGRKKRMRVRVSNQFGKNIRLETIRADRLLIPSSTSLDGFVDPLQPGRADALKCYRLKRKHWPRRRVVKLEDTFITEQLGEEKSFWVREPRRFCSPVRLDGGETLEEIAHSDRHLLCYRIRKARFEPRHRKVWDVYANNTLGSSILETKKERELCVPTKIKKLRFLHRNRRHPHQVGTYHAYLPS